MKKLRNTETQGSWKSETSSTVSRIFAWRNRTQKLKNSFEAKSNRKEDELERRIPTIFSFTDASSSSSQHGEQFTNRQGGAESDRSQRDLRLHSQGRRFDLCEQRRHAAQQRFAGRRQLEAHILQKRLLDGKLFAPSAGSIIYNTP
jgi:hypothetical protein